MTTPEYPYPEGDFPYRPPAYPAAAAGIPGATWLAHGRGCLRPSALGSKQSHCGSVGHFLRIYRSRPVLPRLYRNGYRADRCHVVDLRYRRALAVDRCHHDSGRQSARRTGPNFARLRKRLLRPCGVDHCNGQSYGFCTGAAESGVEHCRVDKPAHRRVDGAGGGRRVHGQLRLERSRTGVPSRSVTCFSSCRVRPLTTSSNPGVRVRG